MDDVAASRQSVSTGADTSVAAFRDAFPILTVRDMPRALAFYRDALGFTVDYRWPAKAAEADIAFATLRLGSFELGLGLSSDAGPAMSVPSAANLPTAQLCFYCDDVDAAVALLAAQGAPILLPPVSQPWGERKAYVADPDGHPVLVTATVNG